MPLKALLVAAALAASSGLASQQTSAQPEASSSAERGRNDTSPSKDEPPAQDKPANGSTSSSADVSPWSIARVREALEKPAPILVPAEPKADFSIRIEKRVPLQDIFATPAWATPAVNPGWGPAHDGLLVSFDVLPLLKAAKRAYAERAAREEVKRAIADYCAAQPNAGAGIQICPTASGGR